MPTNGRATSSTHVVLSFESFDAIPIETTCTLMPGTLEYATQIVTAKGQAKKNTANGLAVISNYNLGEAGEDTIGATVLAVDVGNNADKNVGSLLLGLDKNDLSATAHSGDDHDNTQEAGGDLMVVVKAVTTDNKGVSTTVRTPCTVDSVANADADGLRAYAVIFKIAGDIVIT